ncbi:uncharacterized protein VTP21DRAFT_7426 [Calcarisporiella thermophila]|uniref:uncharacterized protein n=1 Tax=Calcarisporiella thermophila TaxID=911321 RepID=UPI003742C1D3
MQRAPHRKVSYVIRYGDEEAAHCLGINSLALDPTTKGGLLYTAGRDGVVASWNLNLPAKGQKFADDEDEVAIGQMMWRVDTEALEAQSPKSTFSQAFQGHTDWVNDIALCHNNRILISASSDRTLKLWLPFSDTPTVSTTIGHHSDYIRCLAHAPGAGWVASGGFDRKIFLWDIQEGRERATGVLSENGYGPISAIAEGSPKSSIYALACNPTGSILVSGSPEKVVRVWDPKSGNRITNFMGHTDNIRSILVSDDGQLILSASSDSTIKLWSLVAQRCITTYTMHSDSIWSLFSNHPRLEVFYSGSKDGWVFKSDILQRGNDGIPTSEAEEGESIALCKESTGVVKLAALDDVFVWTATSKSSVNRWRDIPPFSKRLFDDLEVPTQSIVKLANPEATFTTADPEKFTVYSATSILSMSPLPSNLGMEFTETLTPVRDAPDYTIPGKHGLVKHFILNNRRHVLTLDTAGEVALYDIIRCVRVKELGQRDLEDAANELSTLESVANWCTIDTRIGSLTIHLDEARCFDGEAYADEAELEEGEMDMRDDQRINLGRWVLSNMFAEFTEEYCRIHMLGHEVARQQHEADLEQFQTSQNASDALAKEASSQLGSDSSLTNATTATTSAIPTPMIIGVATPAVPGAATQAPPPSSTATLQHPAPIPTTEYSYPPNTQAIPQTAPPTLSSPETDYFSSSHYVSQTPSTAIPAANLPAVAGRPAAPFTTQTPQQTAAPQFVNAAVQPPPPAFMQGANTPATTLMGKIRNLTKLTRTPSAEIKFEAPTSPPERPDEEPSVSQGNVPGGEGQAAMQANPAPSSLAPKLQPEAQGAGDGSAPSQPKSQAQSQPQQAQAPPAFTYRPPFVPHNRLDLVNPPFQPALPGDYPRLNIPSSTIVCISEESPEASASVDLYRGTVGELTRDIGLVQQAAPAWLLEFLVKSRVPLREPMKIGFTLRPHEKSGMAELPNGNSRLTANRMLRVRKLLQYVVERLELEYPRSPAAPGQEQSQPEQAENGGKEGFSLAPNQAPSQTNSQASKEPEKQGKENARESEKKGAEPSSEPLPEVWLELVCNDQVLSPTLTLASIRQHVWKAGGDVVITYRYRKPSSSS